MFWNERLPAGINRFVDGEQVNCPIRDGDVELEVCMVCGNLLRFVDDDPPFVVCGAWPDRAGMAGPGF